MSAQALIHNSIVDYKEQPQRDDLMLAIDALIFNSVCTISEPLTNRDISCIHAAKYHLASGGHKVRAQLSLAAGHALGMAERDIIIIAAAVELLHNASLIHDDIQDGDVTRRGLETVWKKFGVNTALCTGDLLLSAAYGVIANFSQVALIPKIITTIHQRTATVIQGQCCDILGKLEPIKSIAEYEDITIAKSGALLSLPLELALIGTNHSADLSSARQAAQHFAIGYQIADDLCDIEKDSACAGKSESMNIIFVLKASGETQDLKVSAKTLALKNLDQSITSARVLPSNAGAALIELAQNLKTKLAVL
jgi:geranylgeranyl pyrophosphate synthase